MSSWEPPAAPAQEEAPPISSPTGRSEVWAAFGRACAISVGLTAAVIVIGWIVLYRRLPQSNGDDSMHGLALVAWALVVPIALGPLFLWAATTYCWRSLDGPSRPIRLTAAVAMLLLPGAVGIPVGLGLVRDDAGDVALQVIGVGIALSLVIGVLLTGRILGARRAAVALVVIAVGGVAVIAQRSAATDARSAAEVRRQLEQTDLPLALPTEASGWTYRNWDVDRRPRPLGQPGDEVPAVAVLWMRGPGGDELRLEMWDAPTSWYCALAACVATTTTVDGSTVLAHTADLWFHEVLPRGEQTWVLTHPTQLSTATIESAFAALTSVDADTWADAVASR